VDSPVAAVERNELSEVSNLCIMIDPNPSITQWLRRLESGDEQVAGLLWDAYFERLVWLVQQRTHSKANNLDDAEDVALSAFASFCRGVKKQQFTGLVNREGLWRTLVRIAIHKLIHRHRDQNRLKRGGGYVQITQEDSAEDACEITRQILSREPSPEVIVLVAEQYDRWMNALGTEELRKISQWKLEGYTNEEIADKHGVTTRTVERKLHLIRKILVHELVE